MTQKRLHLYSSRIEHAIEIASRYHDGQYRKTVQPNIPFAVHPICVGIMLADFGYAEDVVFAGFLHDTVEDTDLTTAQIQELFGRRVACLVGEVSEHDKTLPWKERKRLYLIQIAEASREGQAVSCCDKIHNMKSIVTAGKSNPRIWKSYKSGRERQLEIFSRLLKVYEAGLDARLVREYTTTFHQVCRVED